MPNIILDYKTQLIPKVLYSFNLCFSFKGDTFQCYSSNGRELEKKWNEDGNAYDCRTEANAIKRRCVKFNLSKYIQIASFGFHFK